MIVLVTSVCLMSVGVLQESPRAFGEPWFELIPGILETSARSSDSWGISGDGSVVFGKVFGPDGWEAMTWTRDGGTVPHGGLLFRDSSTAGDRLAGNLEGLYIVGQGWVPLGTPPGADTPMFAVGISADGETVVGYAQAGGDPYPAIWTEADGPSFLTLPLNIAPEGWALRVSSDGSQILGAQANTNYAWLYDGGAAFILDEQAQGPTDMTPDGSVVVGGQGNNSRWYYREPIGYQPIAPGPCNVGEATATDATGGYIVGADDRGCAFIYDRFNGTRDLQTVMELEFGIDLGDFTITGAMGISDDGRTITGKGTYPGGRQSWVAYLPLLRCPGDFVPDDELNIFDILGFLGAFSSNDPAADLTNDGVFNFFDVATFLDLFSQGCL